MNKPKAITEYAVFIKVSEDEWLQQSIPFTSYQEAQAHAKLVRKCYYNIKMARVRRLQRKV